MNCCTWISFSLVGASLSLSGLLSGCDAPAQPSTAEQGAQARTVAELESGRLDGATFVHDGLSLRIEFPADWHVVLGQPGAAAQPTTQASEVSPPRSRTLVTGSRVAPGPEDPLPGTLIAQIEFVADHPDTTPETYLRGLLNTYAASPLGETMKAATIEPGHDLGATQAELLPVQFKRGRVPIYQDIYAARAGDYMFVLIASYTNPIEEGMLDSIVEAIEFDPIGAAGG